MTYYLIKLWPYRMKYREWRLGRFVLRIVQIGKREWFAAVWPREAPEFSAYADKSDKCAVCRSRSRALDVGQRMLKLSAGRGRAVGLG